MWNNRSVSFEPATAHGSYFLLACAAATVVLLLVLIAKVRLHPAVALSVAALGLGVASGMPLAQVPLSFTTGVGNLMGHIAILLAWGAVLGRLLASSGGATALGRALVERCGPKGLPWALLALGILVGMPVFFEVGLVLLMPIVAAAAERRQRPPILVAMPMLAGLSIVHCTLPPHPAAMLAVTQYHADLGRTILWGLIAGLPAAALAGPGLGWLSLRRWEKQATEAVMEIPVFGVAKKNAEESGAFCDEDKEHPSGAKAQADFAGPAARLKSCPDTQQLPPAIPEAIKVLQAENLEFGNSSSSDEKIPAPAGPVRAATAILLPVALIFLGSWANALSASGTVANQILHFIGTPDVALLIAVLVALVTLGGHAQTGQHHGRELLRKLTGESFEPIANVLVILAAAGGLSGILRDSGAAQATVGLALGASIPPLLLAWLMAAVVRVSTGSATVAMAVASAMLAPMAAHAGVRPELLVLATGTGSIMLSHVNDPGFWLIQSFFKLELKETLSTWSVLETVLSLAGLGTTLALSAVLR
ncbi:MAG: SLC13 family permease [Terracidiphilus sp.]